MTTLEKIRAEIADNHDYYFFAESNKDIALGLEYALEIIDKYAEQEPKVTTTSTDEPMVIQYPQVDGITPTVVKTEQEPSRDIKEIAEIMRCDADAETKCKIISNILTAKPHYFAEQDPTSPCDLCKFNTKLMLIEANVSGYAQGLKESSKTGHWIKIVVNGQHKIRCDKCDYTEPEYATHIRNYCPSCGAKMVEPQEREDK